MKKFSKCRFWGWTKTHRTTILHTVQERVWSRKNYISQVAPEDFLNHVYINCLYNLEPIYQPLKKWWKCFQDANLMILTSCFQVSHFSIYNNPGADRICIHTYIHTYIYIYEKFKQPSERWKYLWTFHILSTAGWFYIAYVVVNVVINGSELRGGDTII